MLKLTKYEFRKNLTSTIIILLAIAVSELYFIVSCALKADIHAAISMMLLFMLTIISFVIVIVFGINAYEKELKSKSSYLIFMTPNSSLKIIFSKIVYTLVLGFVLAGILVGLAFLDLKLLSNISETPVNYIDVIKIVLTELGFEYMSIFFGIISSIVSVAMSVFVLVTLAYFSITLAYTFLQNSKARGFLSVVLFFVIFIASAWISNQLPKIYASPATTLQAIVTVLPAFIFDLVIGLACIFGSAALLDKKVSL